MHAKYEVINQRKKETKNERNKKTQFINRYFCGYLGLDTFVSY